MQPGLVKRKLAMGIIALGFAAMPILAHHSVAQQYDMDKIVTIQGVLMKIVWVNPHARLWVDTDRAVSSWEMELPPPNALKLRGFELDSLKEGDRVTVTFWRAKDGSRMGHALTLTPPDGQVVDFPRIMQMGAASR